MTRFTLFLIALAALIPAPAQATEPTCSKTDVFEAPDGDGLSLYGCMKNEVPGRLGSPGHYEDRWGEHQDTWDLIRLRGHFAAFERGYFGCPSVHCRKSELNVHDLRTGKGTARVIDEPGEPYFVGASDLALAHDGSLAWISNRQGRVWLLRARAAERKWLGHHADPRSLQVRAETVSWTRDGKARRYKL